MQHLLESRGLLRSVVENWETRAEKYICECTSSCLQVRVDEVVAVDIVIVHEGTQQSHIGHQVRVLVEHVGEIGHGIRISTEH